MFVYSDIL